MAKIVGRGTPLVPMHQEIADAMLILAPHHDTPAVRAALEYMYQGGRAAGIREGADIVLEVIRAEAAKWPI